METACHKVGYDVHVELQGTTERTITAIEPQERARDRVNVYLNGEFALGVNTDVVVALSLGVGQRITQERLTEVVKRESLAKAKDRAYLFLSYRARTEKEIRDRLQQAGYEDGVIDDVVVKLYELNYLNDTDFAEKFIESRQAERPTGRRAIAFELKRKGVDAETAAGAMAGMDDDSERAAALDAARARAGRYSGLEPREGRRKLAAFLQRRGFAWDTITNVLGVIDTPDDAD
jgi:regulatory protein